ncbi:MAG TPA: hypothetical protein VD905_17765 [Flavobacteriales bacterium]|nr:hypothetical protein [Flavobacteriales bacterium]
MVTSFLMGILIALTPVDARQLLAKTLDNYANAKGLEVHYTIIAAGAGKEKAQYYASENGSYYEDESSIMLVNKNYVVLVKHREKKITVTPRLDGKKTATPTDGFEQAKKGLENYTLKATEQGSMVRIAVVGTSAISDVVYELNKATGTLVKMEYTIAQPAGKKNTKTVIEYTKTDFNKKFDKDFFAEKRLVKKSGKQFVVTDEKYKEYRIVDLTGKN